MKHNYNKPISICGTCGHFNHNAGTFSFCLMQDNDVFEGDYCDLHTKSLKIAHQREMKELQYMGTIFDRGDGRADFGNSKSKF